MCQSDIKLEKNIIIKLILIGLFGGWISGALGLGGGSIYNPALISMNMSPSVSSATGQYMILFSTLASCVVYFIYGNLDWQYSLWVSSWVVLGALVLLHFISKLVRLLHR